MPMASKQKGAGAVSVRLLTPWPEKGVLRPASALSAVESRTVIPDVPHHVTRRGNPESGAAAEIWDVRVVYHGR
jgi:hypothetical protein